MNSLPDWLRLWIQDSLIGEIYPAIRAIAVRFSEERALTLRYYLDREPQEGDRESVAMVMTEILANTSSNDEIREVHEECVCSDVLLKDIDMLDGLVFARREYETDEIKEGGAQNP